MAPNVEIDDGPVKVDPIVEKVDMVIDLITQLHVLADVWGEMLKRDTNTNSQTIYHKTEGVGPWMAAALGFGIALCLSTYLSLGLHMQQEAKATQQEAEATRAMKDDLRDLKAWQQVHQNKISALDARMKEREK